MMNKNEHEAKHIDTTVEKHPAPYYSFYSKVLNKPFDTLAALDVAEKKYYAERDEKEKAALTKKEDAKKVEDAFKQLNAERKTYKAKKAELLQAYSDGLTSVHKAYEDALTTIDDKLREAEKTYQASLKEFTDKYKEGFHLTLKDGDFETTIEAGSSNKKVAPWTFDNSLFNLFNHFFL